MFATHLFPLGLILNVESLQMQFNFSQKEPEYIIHKTMKSILFIY